MYYHLPKKQYVNLDPIADEPCTGEAADLGHCEKLYIGRSHGLTITPIIGACAEFLSPALPLSPPILGIPSGWLARLAGFASQIQSKQQNLELDA